MTRRARAVAMLGASATCAGVAASSVQRHERAVQAQVGALVPVVVARGELRRGTLITPERAMSALVERRVPSRFVPPRTLQSTREAVGFRVAARLSAGDYLGAAVLSADPAAGTRSRRGPPTAGGVRLVEVPVAGASSVQDALGPGAVADVLITTDREAGRARTWVALQRIEVAAFRDGADGATAGDGPLADGVATLRVTLRQAVLLTAARNFARELRLVPRQPGDRRRLPAFTVGAAGFGS
jgi:Flp pilus assembly protein CpaB